MADINKLKPLPPLKELAGLGNIFGDARDALDEMKRAGGSLASEATALRTDIDTVRQHVRKTHEDFHFQASNLGNSGGSSGRDEKQEKQVVEPKDVGDAGTVVEGNPTDAPAPEGTPPSSGQ